MPVLAYRGRLAPSPTGFLHLGHARTFWVAAERANGANGTLLLRSDDLDQARCRPQFESAMQEDLAWLGLTWELPVIKQSARIDRYRLALQTLHALGLIFPCSRSRRDVEEAAGAPHDDEPLYPASFRPPASEQIPPLSSPSTINWRFRVPDGETISFVDGRLGLKESIAGVSFGDFLVWRKDNMPSYQLACAVDDAEFEISEVVRGEDLVASTFRQILLQKALGYSTPAYFHTELVTDDSGQRLAKRTDALSLRSLREKGVSAESICRAWSRGETFTP
jgi:glutamyl/glutaminyl-tRNA synthetase